MIKQKLTALFAAVVMSSAVLADDLSVQPVANAFDESKIFELTPNQQLKAVELSETEMKETEGEWWPVAVVLGRGLAVGAGSLVAYDAMCDTDPIGCTDDVRARAGVFWGGFVAGAIGNPFAGAAAGTAIGYRMSH